MEEEIVPIQISKDVWVVPCLLDKQLKKYRPLIPPSSKQRGVDLITSRKSWTTDEDEKLREIIKNSGPKQWSAVAIELNQSVHSNRQVRKGKQCRERWLGHLDPEIVRDTWTSEEDSILLHQQSFYGNRWSEISKYLPGRTENQIKNRWRKLSKGVKEFKKQKNAFAEVPLEKMIFEVEFGSLMKNY
jgi:hypothetical protein